MLIVIEGIDGSGKDTLADGIADEFGYDRFSFPAYSGVLGQHIKSHLLGEEEYPPEVFQAMQAANKFENRDRLLNAHDGVGTSLVLTRYWQSSIVYGQLDGVPAYWSRRLHATLPPAQINILVDIDPKEAIRRQVSRGLPRERYEGKIETMTKARALYLDIWTEYAGPRWIVIPADGSKEATLERAMGALRPYVVERKFQ